MAIVGTGIAMLIGTTLGISPATTAASSTRSSRGTVDVFLAFPILLLALGVGSACSLGKGCAGGLIKPGMTTVIGIIILISWTYFARLARGQVLSLREKEFVEAARATGAGDLTILGREILPNLVTPILVYMTLVIPLNILIEAALSYLGVGINPPQASWGQMIAEATPYFDSAWWYFLFPGLVLVLTVLAFNILGEAVRDALDPHLSRRSERRRDGTLLPTRDRRSRGNRGFRPARGEHGLRSHRRQKRRHAQADLVRRRRLRRPRPDLLLVRLAGPDGRPPDAATRFRRTRSRPSPILRPRCRRSRRTARR